MNLFPSMNETPFPLVVLAMITLGFPSVREQTSRASSMLGGSLPSASTTSHPKALHFSPTGSRA